MNALKKVLNHNTNWLLYQLHICLLFNFFELSDCYLNQLFKVKYKLQLHQAIVTNMVYF